MLYFTQLTALLFIGFINGEVGGDCPPELNDLQLYPEELLVQYGDPVLVTCHSPSNYTELGWRFPPGNVSYIVNQNVTWNTDSLTDWEIQIVCYMTLDDVQCNRTLPFTMYKLPDKVSISTVNPMDPMTKDKQYELQCDIQNVAPVHLLTVNWYKGSKLVNTTKFTDTPSKFPVNKSMTLQITPHGDRDSVQYRCEAELNLRLEVNQSRPVVMSDPLHISTQLAQCPDLELDPPELVVQYGDPASVSCRYLSNSSDLNWRVPLGNVTSSDNRAVTWKTDNVTDWEIQPVCYKTLDDEQCSRALPLIVYKLPDQVSISVLGHTGPMIDGRKYELQCDIQNFAPVNVLAVFWYKGNELIKHRGFNELPTKTPSNKTITMKITAGKNEPPYRCEAKLKLGSAGPQPPPVVKSNNLSVEVHYKPVITCSDWSPLINTPLNSISSNVMGNPSPTITWFRDKSPVSNDMRLGREDSGQYKYTASNVMGSTSCVTKITVEYAPTFNCPASYEGREHESFSDKCSVMASPAAKITWEKDGATVNPLHNLTRGDSGLYLITAVNKHGTETHSLTINVLYGPEIHADNTPKEVKEDEDVSLSCTAEGNPEPEVMWSFETQTKTTGWRQTTLTISKASLTDAGVYTCTASNELGNVSRTVRLMVKSDCPIKVQPPKLVVEFGDAATANCSTTKLHNGMGWEASQGAVDMKTDVNFIIWTVEKLKHWDIQPICYINVHVQCELFFPLTVYKLPDLVSISTVNHTGPMIEGKQYKLQCDVQNVAPVRLLIVNWYKGQDLVETTNFSDPGVFPVDTTSTLQISTSGDDDGVQYRCEAELKLGPEGPQSPPIVTSDPLHSTVHYKPVITCSDWSPLINTPLNSISSNVMGNPSPTITWFRDKSPVSNDMRLGREDSGQYKYNASNVMGSTSCVTKITVEYAPTFNCPASYKGREHESFSDKCSVMASPAAKITWEKDGATVNPLHNLTRGDSGLYLITAVNKHGTETHSLTINVLYGPEIQLVRPSELVRVGTDVSLTCTAKGNPEPLVEWRFQNQTKATGTRQVTLHISKARTADAGEYTCTAQNKLGRHTKTVLLTVAVSYIRTIMIICGVVLAILIIVAYVIIKYLKRRRSGKYKIPTNGAVRMSLLST